jgi:hypothetical protein
MSIYRYTLPSGSTFTLNAPAETSQATADAIFYTQVASGTFVDYQAGDTLSTPAQSLANFGLSRLKRGTAGVDEKTLLAAIAGLPIVVALPATLNAIPVPNPITTADYVGVTSNSTDPNRITTSGLPPTPVGQLGSQQVQAVMAQLAATIGQNYAAMTQDKGIGKYGFNSDQLERVGYIKPGYSERFCQVDPQTQANPSNFSAFMNSPSVWTGLDGITSVDQILRSPARQNKIQQKLMTQGYNQLVQAGLIIPPTPRTTVPSASRGHVYTASGELVSSSILTLAVSPTAETDISKFSGVSTSICGKSLIGGSLGNVPAKITGLGNTAVSSYAAGLSSLTSGAVRFTTVNGTVEQQTGLATSTALQTQKTISNNVNQDIGALLTNVSKYGALATVAWSQLAGANISGIAGSIGLGGTANFNSLSAGVQGALGGINLNSIGNGIESGFTGAITNVTNLASGALASVTALGSQMLSKLNSLGKAGQFSVNFADNNLGGGTTGQQPGAGFTNTVNRASIDAATVRVIGSDKIPPPVYEVPDEASLGEQADISQAQNILKQVNNTVGSSLTNIGSQVSGLTNGLTNIVPGQIRKLF